MTKYIPKRSSSDRQHVEVLGKGEGARQNILQVEVGTAVDLDDEGLLDRQQLVLALVVLHVDEGDAGQAQDRFPHFQPGIVDVAVAVAELASPADADPKALR